MTPSVARHALVVGGTGMLRAATLGLVSRGFEVSVIARDEGRLRTLREDAVASGGVVHALPLDYRDGVALDGALHRAVESVGPVELAVVWIHGTAPAAPRAVARAVGKSDAPCRYFHVLGSAAADPSRADDGRRTGFDAIPGISYREVVLGFVRTVRGSRWLTNAEIAAGVLDAVDGDAPRVVVGVVEPWSDRP